MFPVDKLNSRFFYDMFIAKIATAPTSQKYFDRLFGHELKWVDIYRLPHSITVNTHSRFFQYKIIHNILFMKSTLFH